MSQTQKTNIWEKSQVVNWLSAQINRFPRLRKFIGYWILVYTLTKRDISARYRRSTLGFFWAFLDPIFNIVVFGILRIFLGISSGDMPYMVFLASGLIPWKLFINIVQNATPSILSNAGIMKKTKVPHELFPLVSAATALFDFMIAMLIILVLMIFYKIPFTWNLLWLPVLIFFLMLFALGAGMWIAAFGVFRRDIIRAGAYFFQLFFYLSPVFYPIDLVPDSLRKIYILNPLVGLFEGFRNILGFGKSPNFETLIYAIPVILILFLLGWRTFRQRSRYFADHL